MVEKKVAPPTVTKALFIKFPLPRFLASARLEALVVKKERILTENTSIVELEVETSSSHLSATLNRKGGLGAGLQCWLG